MESDLWEPLIKIGIYLVTPIIIFFVVKAQRKEQADSDDALLRAMDERHRIQTLKAQERAKRERNP